jgi:hypothetical protein
VNVKEFREAVNDWDATSLDEDVASTSKYGAILSQLEFLGADEWSTYLPALNPVYSRDFVTRLAAWVGQVTAAADKQLLLEYAQRICFFSQEDFFALYRSAFNGPITRWVIEEHGLLLNSPNFAQELNAELNQHTWYCAITDSMSIADFYHINGITGISSRPYFKDLEELSGDRDANSGNIATHKAYMSQVGLKRIVLLEDVVGSGSQTVKAIKWALSSLGVPILFSPLVVCPRAAGLARSLVNAFHGQLAFGPVIELSRRNMLGPDREPSSSSDDAFAQRIEEFAVRSFSDVAGAAPPLSVAPYDPFGFAKTGSSIVTYTNTPDNTLPLVHHLPSTGTWAALFPRSSRV